MSKRILVGFLVLVLFVTMFAGCSNTGTQPSEPSSGTSSPSTQPDTSNTDNSGNETANFTPASEIVPPAGKTLNSLPVDKVAEKPLKIATVMVQNNPFGAAVKIGQDFAKEILADRNCTVDVLSVEDFDPQKWTSVLENCIATGYDAICFFGVSEALQPVVDKGVDAGILMYVFNSEPGESKRQAYYGLDGTYAGQECAKALEELMGGEGEYIIITGDFSVPDHEKRRKGALSVLEKNPKLVNKGEFENNDKAEEAYSITTNAILANPNLKGIYVTAGGPSGAAKAIEDAGKVDQIALVCHDILAESAPYIASGTIKACIDQDPFNQGYQPVIDAFNKLVADITPEEVNWYEGKMATPENVKELFPEFFK